MIRKRKKSSDRAKKWKDHLAKRTKSPKRATNKAEESSFKSDATTVGGNSYDKVAYPRVLLDEGEDAKPEKEPEIGSI